jgi:perosamine synthetase
MITGKTDKKKFHNWRKSMHDDSYAKYSNLAINNALSMLRGKSFAFDVGTSDWVERFERDFSSWSGKQHNIAVNSGTSALHTALVAAGIGPGDEVVMPALSVVMNAYAAIAVGAVPVFADVDEATWNISLDTVLKVVSTKTRAIITVSWFGMPVDFSPIVDWAHQNNVVVIEDAAESLGATYKGRPSGQLADLVTFSFENKKHLTTGGEGGMVSTSSEELATKARKFAGLGYKHLTADQGRTSLAASVFQRPDYKRYDTISLNYRMSPLSAAVGLGQLDYLKQMVDQRIKNSQKLFEVILNDRNFDIQRGTFDYCHSYYTASVIYKGPREWLEIYESVKAKGGDGFYGCVLNPYLEPVFEGKESTKQKWVNGLNPVAEALQPKIMAIKSNFRNEDDLARNIRAWKAALHEE